MTNQVKKQRKKKVEVEKETFELINADLQYLSQSQTLQKLQNATSLRAAVKFSILKWMRHIFTSSEFLAYEEARRDMLTRLQSKWEALPEPGRPSFDNYLRQESEVQEFFNSSSGLRISKLVISTAILPEEVTVADMLQTDKYIEWVE